MRKNAIDYSYEQFLRIIENNLVIDENSKLDNLNISDSGIDSLSFMSICGELEEYYKIKLDSIELQYVTNFYTLYNLIIDSVNCKKNKEYPLYKVSHLQNFSELFYYLRNNYSQNIAFIVIENDNVKKISYQSFINDICKVITFIKNKNYRNRKIGLLGNNNYYWLVLYYAIVCSGNIAIPTSNENKKQISEVYDCDIFFCNNVEISQKDIENSRIEYIDSNQAFVKESINFDRCFENQDGEQIALIVNTSGTNGKPKGVELTQKNLIINACSVAETQFYIGITMNTLPFEHLYGLNIAIGTTLLHGQCIYLGNCKDSILEQINLIHPVMMYTVPFCADKLISELDMSKKEKFRINLDFFKRTNLGLKFVISASAPLGTNLIKKYKKYGITLINGYGATECSPGVACNRKYDNKVGSVGRPISCNEVIIDNVNTDGIGEIVIKGQNVLKKYYNGEAIGDVYHTGDIGKIKDGYLYICGRIKNMILLSNGENVFPEELELLIKKSKYISEAIVYQNENLITAEIELADKCYDKLAKRDILMLNKKLPTYKQIRKIIIRDKEFDKVVLNKVRRTTV